MFLLLLGYQHYDFGWTFIDIGPYSIDSMEITFTVRLCHKDFLTNYWYIVKSEAWQHFPKNVFKAMFHFGRTNCFRATVRTIRHYS